MVTHHYAQGFEHAVPHSSRRDFASGLSDAIRENPVPAALIGMGVLWMFMGGNKTTLLGDATRSLFSGVGQGAQHVGRTAYHGAESVGAGISTVAGAVAGAVKEGSSQVQSMARSAADAVGDSLGNATAHASSISKAAYDTAGDLMERGVDAASRATTDNRRTVSTTASEASRGLQGTLAEVFERQPLLIGAVGVAVGAAMAAAMPATDAEKRLVGETADTVRERVEDFVTQKIKDAGSTVSKGLGVS